MELARGYRAYSGNEINNFQNGLNYDTLLVIKLPDSKVLRVMARSLFLSMVIVSFPWLESILRESSNSLLNADDYDSGFTNLEFLNSLFQDLRNEGLIKKGDTALLVGFGNLEPLLVSSRFFKDNEIHLVVESNLERLGLIKDETFDFAFVLSTLATKIIDHAIKVGGVMVLQLSNEISDTYQKQVNYRMEYLRQYSSTILAMRKTYLAYELIDSSAKRRLCHWALDAKQAALKNLEDILLDQPRNAFAKLRELLRKIKFLPDLLGDSVESYLRRVFVYASLSEEKGRMMDWFHGYYPMGQEFYIYILELVTEDFSGQIMQLSMDVFDWLQKNVKEEEYVVMKVDAEVLEEIIEKQTICVADELFLVCKHQWEDEENKNPKKSRMAYWECVALCARLRRETGVSVHQWWE